MDARQYVEAAVEADALFVSRFVQQARREDPELLTHLLFIAAPWIGTFVYESGRALRQVAPERWSSLGPDADAVSTRARHGLKLFEDTKRNIDQHQSYFAAIAAAHRAVFVDRVPARYQHLADDLGVTTIDGRLLYTTHAVSFALGIEPDAVSELDGLGPRLYDIYSEFGGYFSHISPPDGRPARFLARTAKRVFSATDLRSDAFYARTFTGQRAPYLNAVLLHFEGLIRGTRTLFPLVDNADAIERYSLFKVRWLVATHIRRSLRALRSREDLHPDELALLDQLLTKLPLREDEHAAYRPLRNLLVHYHPTPAQVARLDPALPLLERTLAAVELSGAAEVLTAGIERTYELLDESLTAWHHLPETAARRV